MFCNISFKADKRLGFSNNIKNNDHYCVIMSGQRIFPVGDVDVSWYSITFAS